MRFKLLIIALLFSLVVCGQSSFQPLNGDAYDIIGRFDIKYGKVLPITHTSVKPYSRKWEAQFVQSLTSENLKFGKQDQYNVQYLFIENPEWLKDTTIKSKKPFLKYFYRDPGYLFSVDVPDFTLKINPVLHFELGGELGTNAGDGDDNQFRFLNTRGLELRANIKKKISFYTFFTDNQMRKMLYVQQRIIEDQAVPGEGFYKDGFRTTGVDYFTARGYVTFNVLDHIDFMFGHDKNFIGNGMRSLFLSDYSNNYLFLKMQITVWRIKYTSLFTQMISTYNRGGDQLLPKKYAAFHYLDVSITHWLNIGVFEGVIHNRENGFDLNYLNPIIFYRAIEQALGSPDNAIIGLDFKANIAKHVQLYGQFILDEFNFEHVKGQDGWWANKFGVQGGVKYIDMIGIDNFDGQIEVNWIRPYVYTHTNFENTYTNYNQPLAHPLGANLLEFIGQIRYQILPTLNARLKFMYAQKGTDNDTTNWGGNIFLPTTNIAGELTVEREFGNEVLQGVKHKIALIDFLLSYQVRHNIYFDFNIVFRKLNSDDATQNTNNAYFGLGARMNIPYRSWDF